MRQERRGAGDPAREVNSIQPGAAAEGLAAERLASQFLRQDRLMPLWRANSFCVSGLSP
jgi:hypothetical protein